jgi:hypothetical protein
MVEAILDAHYLSRDIQLAKAAALKLERAQIQPTLKQRRSVIEEGGHTRMRELEARGDVLKKLLAHKPGDVPDIPPERVAYLSEEVERLPPFSA